MLKAKLTSLCLLVAITLAACDGSSTLSVDDHLERAQNFLKEADFRGSVIELKNVLQVEPDNTKARILLAEVYTEVGDGESAGKEISRAIRLGAKGLKVQEILGKTYNLRGKFQQVLEEYPLKEDASATSSAVISLLRADAYYGLHKNLDAEAAYASALAFYKKDINEERPHLKLTEPAENINAMIGVAKISIRRGLWQVATDKIAHVLQLSPNNTEALSAKGEIEFKKNNPAESEKAFQAAFTLKPYNLEYQIGLARAQIALGKVDEAIANIETVRKHFPNYIIANQYRGLAALKANDHETAKEFADRILKVAPDYYPAHLIAGVANFGLRNFEQANIFLSRFTTFEPNNLNARKLLAMTQLYLRRGNDALETLQPISETYPENLEIIQLMAQAAIEAGNLNKAGAYYQKAVDINPDDPNAQMRMAFTKIAQGDNSAGLKMMRDSVKKAPNFLKGKYILMEVYLREGEYDKSIEMARELQTTDPENTTPYIGEGLSQIQKKSWPDAIAAFENAIKISPNHFGAFYGLADVYLATNRPEEARTLYKTILETHPRHYLTLMRWIGLETREGDQDQVNTLLQRTIDANPNAVPPRILVAQSLLESNHPLKAIASLGDLLQRHPTNPGLLQIIGRAQLASQKAGEAAVILERLVKVSPNSPGAHFLFAQAQGLLGNRRATISELDMALTLKPDFFKASIVRVRALILDDKSTLALDSLRKIKANFPNNDDIASLESWVATQLGNHEQAIIILQKQMRQRPNEITALKISAAYWNAKQQSKAIEILQTWAKENELSAAVGIELANYYISLERTEDAMETWEKVIKIQPNNWISLNNLAHNLRDKDLTAALKYSERAYKLAPNMPPVSVTLANLILMDGKTPKRVVQILRPVAARLPENMEVQLTLAEAFAAVNKRDEARKIIDLIRPKIQDKDLKRKADILAKSLSQ